MANTNNNPTTETTAQAPARTKETVKAEIFKVADAERRTFKRYQRLSCKGGAAADEARATWEAMINKLSALEGEYFAL